MTDQERRARQMVQYHIEGEHVFPEPECPSCRAERLDAALKRAAEMLAEKMCERCHQLQGEHGTVEFVYLHSCYHFEGGYLEGWAAAVSILADIADDPRDGFAKLDSYQRRKLGDTHRAFIRAMLGGDDA